MEKDHKWDDLNIKTSRISFLSNYIIGSLAIIFIVLFLNAFTLKFTLFPKTLNDMFSSLAILGLVMIAGVLLEQPEWVRFMRRYKVTLNEVIEIDGLFTKKKIILPYQSIAEVTVKRDILGRMLNYGDVSVSAFGSGTGVHIRGVRNAEKIHELIQNRINILREGQLGFFKDKDVGEQKPKKKKPDKTK